LKPVRFRAVVLAAGFGRRLRPLTDWLPKPLLPVCGKPVVLHTLEALAAAGCEATALNLHHLGEPIRRRLGDDFEGMPLTYSEEPEILGTLGALYPLRDFIAGAEHLLIVNGDSLCRWPLAGLLRRHVKSRPQVGHDLLGRFRRSIMAVSSTTTRSNHLKRGDRYVCFRMRNP